MVHVSSSAETACTTQVEVGVAPNLILDSDADSDSGSGVPEAAISTARADVTGGGESISDVEQTSENESVENGTGALSSISSKIHEMAASAALSAYGRADFYSISDAVWEIGEYNGSDETWVEGYIFVGYPNNFSIDTNTQKLVLTGRITVGDNDIFFDATEDGVISVGGVVYDFEDSNIAVGSISPSDGVGVFSFRFYVTPGEEIHISVVQDTQDTDDDNFVEIECGQNESAELFDAEFVAGVWCQAHYGTPE